MLFLAASFLASLACHVVSGGFLACHVVSSLLLRVMLFLEASFFSLFLSLSSKLRNMIARRKPTFLQSYSAVKNIVDMTQKGDTQHFCSDAEKGETQHFCSDTACGKSFRTRELLARHVVRVHGDKKFPCRSPLCDKKFASLGDVNNHFRQSHVSSETGSFWKGRKRTLEHDERKKRVRKVVN